MVFLLFKGTLPLICPNGQVTLQPLKWPPGEASRQNFSTWKLTDRHRPPENRPKPGVFGVSQKVLKNTKVFGFKPSQKKLSFNRVTTPSAKIRYPQCHLSEFNPQAWKMFRAPLVLYISAEKLMVQLELSSYSSWWLNRPIWNIL